MPERPPAVFRPDHRGPVPVIGTPPPAPVVRNGRWGPVLWTAARPQGWQPRRTR
jgi:hypothetical protein